MLFRYDFDSDGNISEEDCRLVLSYVPLAVSKRSLFICEIHISIEHE